jgi:hypothetical protein
MQPWQLGARFAGSLMAIYHPSKGCSEGIGAKYH